MAAQKQKRQEVRSSSLMVAQKRKRHRSLPMQAIDGGTGGKAAIVADVRA
jgi:hypothetical protein